MASLRASKAVMRRGASPSTCFNATIQHPQIIRRLPQQAIAAARCCSSSNSSLQSVSPLLEETFIPCSPSPRASSSSSPAASWVCRAAVKGKGFGAPSKAKAANIEAAAPCPCKSGSVYEACCGRFHSGAENPTTAEQLLRSRYCAYHGKLPEYIADTTHPNSTEWNGTRTVYLGQVKQTQKRYDYQDLQILKSEGGSSPLEHFINFKLTFKDRIVKDKDSEPISRTERSRFLKLDGKWYFMDSELPEVQQGGGNLLNLPNLNLNIKL